MPVRLGMRTGSLSSKRHLAQEWVYVVLISRIPRYFGNVTRPFTVKTWFCWFSFGACVSGGLKEHEGKKRRLVALAASLHWDGIARLLQGWTEWNENSTDARSFCPGESFEWCQLCQLLLLCWGCFFDFWAYGIVGFQDPSTGKQKSPGACSPGLPYPSLFSTLLKVGGRDFTGLDNGKLFWIDLLDC